MRQAPAPRNHPRVALTSWAAAEPCSLSCRRRPAGPARPGRRGRVVDARKIGRRWRLGAKAGSPVARRLAKAAATKSDENSHAVLRIPVVIATSLERDQLSAIRVTASTRFRIFANACPQGRRAWAREDDPGREVRRVMCCKACSRSSRLTRFSMKVWAKDKFLAARQSAQIDEIGPSQGLASSAVDRGR